MSKTVEGKGSDNIPPGSVASLTAAIAQDRTKDEPVASSRAETFLDEQTHLIRLQAEQLNEQRRLLLGSLRFRHAGEVLSVTIQLMLGFVGLVIVVALTVGIWSALHDNGLVVAAFDVPPDLAARGLTGKVVASQLLDHLSTLQDETASSRAAGTYKNNWGDDIKVEIPQTGISVGEFYRYMREWLGHETHIDGEIYRTSTGIAVTARTGGASGRTFEGPETDLSKLLQQAAEDVYRRTQPYRYSVYLYNRGDSDTSELVLREMLARGPASEFKWAHVGLANTLIGAGDFAGAARETQRAIAIDPAFGQGWYLLAQIEAVRGHDGAVFDAIDRGIPLLAANNKGDLTQRAVDMMVAGMKARRDEFLGDYAGAARENETAANLPDYGNHARLALIGRAADLALAHDPAAATGVLESVGDPVAGEIVPYARAVLILAAEEGDRRTVDAAFGAKLGFFRIFLESAGMDASVRKAPPVAACLLQPWAAFAAARSGALAEARARIAAAPDDCDVALRVRADIDAASHNWSLAQNLFAIAQAGAPSLPFAASDFGAMLLARGEADGAIAKFSEAHDKAPRFADPLELWGEALMHKNRSDLALVKFEEANKSAPRWGRLHLKWGEALAYAGRGEDAAAQYAICEDLALRPGERAELARGRHSANGR